MKTKIAALAALMLAFTGLVTAHAGEPITLGWDPYDEEAEGTSGFYIYISRNPNVDPKTAEIKIKIENPAVDSYVVTTLKPGRWYSVATAYAIVGEEEVESDVSNEDTFIARPGKPIRFGKML